jgi:hypothetical protein
VVVSETPNYIPRPGEPDDIWQGLIQTHELPYVGQGVDLIGPDDTIVHTNCTGYFRFGIYNGVEIVAAEYGAEYLEVIASYIRNRRNRKFDSVILFTGEEGAGKSTLSLKLAKHIDPEFPLERVCFKIDEFSKRIDDSPNGSVISFDEAGFDMFNQQWWADFQQELIKKLLVIRAKELIIILCVPHRMELNKKLRERRCTFWIDVLTRGDDYTRGFATFRRGKGNEWNEEKYWEGMAAFRFSEMSGQFWDAYNVKKWAFINEVSAGEYHASGGNRAGKAVEGRDRAIHWLYHEFKKNQKQIATKLKMSPSAISLILKKDLEKGKTSSINEEVDENGDEL